MLNCRRERPLTLTRLVYGIGCDGEWGGILQAANSVLGPVFLLKEMKKQSNNLLKSFVALGTARKSK